MVTQINRKVFRDLGRMKMQVLTIVLVIASGVAALIAFLSTQDSLKRAQSRFYQESRFADVFAELKRAPTSLEPRLAAIPGVIRLETRIMKDFLLFIPGRVETAVGRFISFPKNGGPELNRLYLRKGRMLDPNRTDEVLVSEGFAEANGFSPGDSISALINGKYKQFHIVGTVLSPEYIYAIRGETPIPDDRHFGIFWTSRKGLEAALDMEGSFNSLSLLLGPGASSSAVISALDEQLLRYGGLGAYDREDQVSNRFLSDEINQNRVMAVAIPLIFLSVAAFLLNVVLSRMVGLQRSQIATLKALGYGNFTIALHYFKMVVVITFFGILAGVGIGAWLGHKLTVLYTDFYRFPLMIFFINPSRLLLAGGVTFLAALLGVLLALRQVVHLQPAEAMRPPAPPAFHESLWEHVGVTRFLSHTGKMIYRNLTFRPLRTILGVFGIAFAIMITMIGLFWWDTIHFIIYSQFYLTQREDAEVLFVDEVPRKALLELHHYPGVLAVEGYRTVPIRLRFGHRHVRTALLGYPPEAEQRLLLDRQSRSVPLPPEGLLISQLLARRLRAEPGESLEVEVLEGKRQKWRLPISAVVNQWVGYAAYMDLDRLQHLLDDQRISSATLRVDSRFETELQKKLRGLPTVAAVNFKRNVLENFKKTMVQFILVFATVLTVFALIIAVGVVYNNARISLSERAWELMSLRVLGFNRKDVFRILAYEIIFQIIPALPLGWLLGYLFAALLIKLMHTESFDIPLILERQTFAYASLVVVIATVFSFAVLRYRLNRTNLVTALKVRE